MMRKNCLIGNQGFAIEGTFSIVALISLATLAIFSLTPAKNLINLAGDGGQKTTQTQSYKETMEPYTENGQPVKVKLQDGSEGLIFKRVVSSDSLDETTQPKLPWWKKLMQVGWWWLALTIAGMFFGPLGMVMNAINSKAKKAALAVIDKVKEEHEEMVSEAKMIVTSIDKGKVVFKTAIAAADSAAKTARDLAAATTDPKLMESYAAIEKTQTAISKAISDVWDAHSAVIAEDQDKSTKLLVSKLRNGGVT